MRLFEPGSEAALYGPLRRVMLLVAYDGSPFRGFAAQPGERTVGGALASALGSMAGHEVSLTCAGRTDAGVHALGQVVHADVDEAVVAKWAESELRRGRPWSGCPARSVASSDRRSPSSRPGSRPTGSTPAARRAPAAIATTCSDSPWPDPLLRHSSWHVPDELDLAAMRIGADALLGEHDFAAFCRRPPGESGPITRRVLSSSWDRAPEDERLWRFQIEASAFCHQMVRSIVGTLVAVGQGRMRAGELLAILRSGDRSRGGQPAPPRGLCLVRVRYPAEMIPGGCWEPGRSLWQADCGSR